MKTRQMQVVFAFTLCALSLLISCENKESKTNNITFDTISVTKVYHFENDSTAPSCSLKLSYIAPVKYTDDSILQKIQNELNILVFDDEVYARVAPHVAAEQYGISFVDNYQKDVRLYLGNKDSEADDAPSKTYYSIYKNVETKIVFNKADILSYQCISVDYKGEKNSSTLYRNTVFDLNTGKHLTEEDIFIPEYKELLDKIVLDKILSQNKAKSVDDLNRLGFWLEDFTTNDNFLIDDKGITYIFNEDEYSSRTIGRISVFVAYYEIEHILLPASPISVLAKK